MPSRSNAWLAILGCVAAVALGCASEEETVARHVAAAEGYQEAGDFRSALVELQSALRVQPKNADLNLRLARLFSATNKPARAAFFYGEAYRLDPSLSEAALSQAPALYATDPDAASALVEEVIEREPDNVMAYVRRSELQLLQADTDGALASALTAAELDPRSVIAHRTIGSVHRARFREMVLRGREVDGEIPSAALAAFGKAEKLSADLERQGAWYDRLQVALIYSDWEGHGEAAMEAFREAFALAEAKGDRGGMLSVTRDARALANRERDTEFTRWTLERWVETEPGAEQAWRLLARLEAQQGGSADAVWQRAFEGQPDDIGLHAGYTRVLADEGRIEEATAHLDSLPPELASAPEVGALRVELLLSNKKLDDARRALEELENAHPESPITRLARAKLDLQDGRVDEALVNLRNLAGEVDRADVLRQLAIAEARTGNADAAIAAADRAIEFQPTRSVVPHRVRMRMLARRGDWAGVLRAYRELRRLGLPIGPQLNRLRIQALYETGRADLGRRVLKEALEAEKPPLTLVLLYHHYESAIDPKGSRAQLLDAAERYPNDSRVVQALVLLDLDAGHGEQALARLDAYNERGRTQAMLGLRAQILWALGRGEEAEASALAGFHQEPRATNATSLLVTILTEKGKQDEAIELLESSRKERGLDPASLWQLGRLYLARGELELARQRLDEAHRAAPGLLHIQNDLAYVLAESEVELDRAVELARAVKAGRPEDAAVADTLGYVYLKKGLVEPAAFEFRSAIELARVRGSEVADYHYHLGLALQAQGRTDAARAAFGEALRIEPQHKAAQQAQAAAAAAPGAG